MNIFVLFVDVQGNLFNNAPGLIEMFLFRCPVWSLCDF